MASTPPQRHLNRELSWLDFDERVLDLATEPGIPLLERAKFVAIFAVNLDEFFQVRVAGLRDQVAAGIDDRGPDGMTPLDQLVAITERVAGLVRRHESVFLDEILPALAAEGVAIVDWGSLTSADRAMLGDHFRQRIFPVLTPLAVDPGHPFPNISNLALSIAAHIADPETGDRRFVRLKVPSVFDRLVPLGDGRFVPAEQVIAAHLHTLFVGMVVEEVAVFRVTRNADLAIGEDGAEDLLEAVELELRKRRFNRVIRLEVVETISEGLLDLLVRQLDVDRRNVSWHRTMLDLGCLWELHRVDRPDLKDRAWQPLTAGRLLAAHEADRSVCSVIREGSMLLHHPYESFDSSIERWIGEAAADPKVQSIKMTLYRAGERSQIIDSLVRAAEAGTQVVVLVELTARFDEAANVEWARQLERAGVHVVYGMAGLKTHAKVVLIVRDDGDALRAYTHIGTGNYNSRTARSLEDLGLLTCDPVIGTDATHLFNYLTGYSRATGYGALVVAPDHMKESLIDLIDREAGFGTAGSVVLKCNSIADPDIVEALYRASDAGTRVEGIVRSVCTMRAGVPGLSDHVAVRSLLGRYFENSRVYRFGHGDDAGGPLHLIGSADLMPRNLERRVEVLVPITEPRHRAWLDEVIAIDLRDDIVRWELEDDTWHRRGPLDVFTPDAQALTYRRAVERQAQRRP